MSIWKEKRQGFTIIDTLVTLAIAALLLGLALPSLSTALAKHKVLSQAQDIGSQIQSARYRALRNNAMCSFILSASGRQFGIDGDADGNLTPGTQDLVLSLADPVTFINLETPPVAAAYSISVGEKTGIGFTPRGTLTGINSSTGLPDFTANFPAGGMVIYLRSPQNEFAAVTISPAGRLKTWRSTNGVNWQPI